MLIANGANVNALNKEGETPLDIRIEHPGISGFMPSGYNTTDTLEETEEDPLVTLLRKHGAKTGDELIPPLGQAHFGMLRLSGAPPELSTAHGAPATGKPPKAVSRYACHRISNSFAPS